MQPLAPYRGSVTLPSSHHIPSNRQGPVMMCQPEQVGGQGEHQPDREFLMGVRFPHQSPHSEQVGACGQCRGSEAAGGKQGAGEGGTEQGKEAMISVNHVQDPVQPPGQAPRNRSQQCTLMRERKFHFIYLLFMPSTLRKYLG